MSLDVALRVDEVMRREGSGIFIKRDGWELREISRDEWDDMCPWHEPTIMEEVTVKRSVFDTNVTHNLTGMAAAAGIYEVVWCPEEVGITKAGDLIAPLERGIFAMKANPKLFEKRNPPNGWGSYEGFVPWLERYLDACREYPDAEVSVSR